MKNPYDPQFNMSSSKEDLLRDIDWLNNELNKVMDENEELRKACQYWERAYKLSKPIQYESSKWEDVTPASIVDLTKDAKPYVNPFNNPAGVPLN
jgi:hypothetical protein